MTNPVKIPHPLRSRNGASQRRRVLDALQPGAAPIDGRSLADILYFISQYATQVNFFEVQQDDNLGEYLETSDWRNFFEQSAPFQLARISKVDADQLAQADYVIRPNVDGIGMVSAKSTDAKHAIEAGEMAARSAIPAIRELIEDFHKKQN